MKPAPSISLAGSYTINGEHLFGPLTIDIPAEQWTCLLGASGIGKSTILRLILGLKTAGVFSGNIIASDGDALANRISYMAQSDLLLPWLNVHENVVLGAKLRGEQPDMPRAKALIERVGLTSHQDKHPAALSGGMRQRAALARTLMEDRPIVLLDEPFSALDASTRADMQELAAEMLTGKTVLLVTHDPAEASRLGHKIILMSANEAAIWDQPNMPPIRAIDAPETLACQSALLSQLRGQNQEERHETV